MTDHHRFEYDVAISFAVNDKPVARKLGELLSAKDIKVLYDEYESVRLGGSDFVIHVAELYRTKAQYCLMLISKDYPLEKWTAAERARARQHALRDSDAYILPIILDDSEPSGVSEVGGYYDLRQNSPESLADWLDRKMMRAKPESGPPEESHDLRSGNLR